MTSRTRYGLIAAGFAFFFIFGPIIVIFLGGYRYDSATRGFTQTGAIGTRTDPNGADITVNGQDKGTTPKSIRFLLPGDYSVSLDKDGYRTWSKRLSVTTGVVTSANQGIENVTLFYDVPLITPIAADVTGYFAGSKRLVYTDAGHVYATDISSPTKNSALPLGLPQGSAGTGISITASPDENYFLLSAADGSYHGIFSAPNNSVTALDQVLSSGLGQEKVSDFQFGPDDTLYALDDDGLYSVDWRKGSLTQVSQESISSFSPHNDGLYMLARAKGLKTGPLALEKVDPQSYQVTVLYSGLPDWQSSSLYLNQFNQPALIGNGNLYGIGSTGQYAQQYVQEVSAEPGTPKMLYATNNELGLFDPGDGSISVITRSSQPITSSDLSLKTGWAFYIAAGQLQAIELDTRDHQNSYSLERVSDGAQFTVDASAQYVYLLDGGNLSRLQIR